MAARNNMAFANDWQWLFGIPIVAFVIGIVIGDKPLSTGYPILDGILFAFGAFVVTWAVAFTARLLTAPIILHDAEKARADRLVGQIEQLSSERSPRLRFGEIVRDHPPVDQKATVLERILLENINDGTEQLVECIAKIVSVRENFGPPQILQSTIPTVARHNDGVVGRFKLVGGETKLLLVATSEVSAGTGLIHALVLEVASLPIIKTKNYSVELIALAERGSAAKTELQMGVNNFDHIWIKKIEPIIAA